MTRRLDREALTTFRAEAVATALLMVGGLTAVVPVVSPTGPLAGLDVPGWVRRFVAGGLFGLSGTAATLSRGRRSGAHLNPAVTLAFRAEGTISTARAVGYVAAQVVGAVAGAAVVRAVGPVGPGLGWGTTVPAAGLTGRQAAGLGPGDVRPRHARAVDGRASAGAAPDPVDDGPLYAVMVAVEAPLTGTSSNPARSLGPALVTWTWTDAWVYWVGPAVGALAAVAMLRLVTRHRVTEARLVYDRLVHEAETDVEKAAHTIADDVSAEVRRLRRDRGPTVP